jgi:esterase/lipase superfamily enzyme
VELQRVDLVPPEQFSDTLSRRLERSEPKDVLIYVHGYRTTFKDAIETAAALATNLNFKGVPIAFTWPSDGTALAYSADEEEAPLSRDSLLILLKAVRTAKSVARVDLLTHSMGGRIAVASLEWLHGQNPQQPAVLQQLIFAAPDVFTEAFQLAADSFPGTASRVTLYASATDIALLCSNWIHAHSRAGQAGEGMTVLPGIDTIDVSNVEPYSPAHTPCSGGHSYFTRNAAVLSDLHELIAYDAPPSSRHRLEKRQKNSVDYWVLRAAASP